MAQLEIACFNLNSAIIAQKNGVNRVELCAGFEVGGTTPKKKEVVEFIKLLSIDLYVMIRPRGGDFIYSDDEFSIMKNEIKTFKELKVTGFVFGILNEDKTINLPQNKELIELAKPFPCTFHRAFDEVPDAFQSLENVIDCGFTTILTSGQAQNAVAGIELITELVKKANNRIFIMPGGSLRSSNVRLIQQNTKARFFHSSAIIDESQMANAEEIIALKTNLK
ncbi:copper homeostasis protein CutC [uncultured Flavobacterium sp.]|jgi:copper homeostasis protein|uniref:copper homeostasis protein CutC n=1 Tax=uncultured Flavobacterium sp. TaxID=165435 RepID=UPI0030CA2231